MNLAERKRLLRERMKNDVKNKDKNISFGKRPLDLSDYPNTSFYDPKSGTKIKDDVYDCAFDIIPWIVRSDKYPDSTVNQGSLAYKLIFLVHRNVGINNDQIICPRTFGHNCPICEEWKHLYDEGKEKEAEKIGASYRVAYNFLDLNDPDAGVQLFVGSRKYFDIPLMSEIAIVEKKTGNEIDLLCNHIECRATQEVWNKIPYFKYSNFVFEEKEEDDSLIEQALPIEELLVVLPYEEIKQIFYNESEDATADEKDKKRDDNSQTENEHPETSVNKTSERKTKEKAVDKEKSIEDMDLHELRKYARNLDRKPPLQVAGKNKKELLDMIKNEEEAPQTKDRCESGHKFGEDCDEFTDCGNCREELWDACCKEFEKKK